LIILSQTTNTEQTRRLSFSWLSLIFSFSDLFSYTYYKIYPPSFTRIPREFIQSTSHRWWRWKLSPLQISMEGDSVQNSLWGRRRGMVCRCGSKTATRHTKPEVVVDHIYMTTRHSKLEVVIGFTKYPFWSGRYSPVCMDFFFKID